MDYLDGGFPAAFAAMSDLVRDHGAGLPDVTYGVLAAMYPSPVARVVDVCEALYAAADALPPAGLVLCAQLARFAQENGFHHLGQTERAPKMILAMRRRLGELTETEAPPADDPEPQADFAPPAEA